MSQEKKPANYYGGYSLYRGGSAQSAAAPPHAANLQGARKAAAAFGGDWFGNAMMAGMMPPMMSPFVAPPPAATVDNSKNPRALHTNAATGSYPTQMPKPGMPFLGNFFAPVPTNAPSIYKGTPVQRNVHQQHHQLHNGKGPMTSTMASSAKRSAVTSTQSHFNEWTAFDAVAPAVAHVHRHLDPIGTPAHSVWEGTPAAAEIAVAKPVICPLISPVAPTQNFSVWNSGMGAMKDVASRSGASTPSESEHQPKETQIGSTAAAAPSSAFDADDDWLEHLKSTLHTVLLEEESASSPVVGAVAASKRTSTPPTMKFEKEWAQRSMNHGL